MGSFATNGLLCHRWAMPLMGSYATDGLLCHRWAMPLMGYMYILPLMGYIYILPLMGLLLPLMVFYPHVCFEAEMEEHRGGGGSQNCPRGKSHFILG